MLDKTQFSTQTPHSHPSDQQNLPLPASLADEEGEALQPHFWKGRVVQLVVSIGICGVLAFVLWSLPLIRQMPPNGMVFIGYVLALTPTLAAILAVLLIFVIWWYAADYGWIESIRSLMRKHNATPVERQGERQDTFLKRGRRSAKKTRTVGVRQWKRHKRQESLQDRIAKRKRHLYRGRVYRGTTKARGFGHISDSLSLIAVAGGNSENQTQVPLDEDEILQVSDEDGVALLGVELIASTSDGAVLATRRDAETVVVGTHVSSDVRKPLSLYLLSEFVIEVQNSAGAKKSVTLQRKRRGDDRYTARDLLALLAALRGKRINRLKLLESVFGYGLPDKKRDPEKLRNQLNKATQYLREDINEVASSLGLPELKVIGSDHDEWYLLSSECRVVDLDEVDACFAQLEGIPPQKALEEWAQQACERLIKSYRGSFMERYIEEAVQAGHDEWDANWMRPFYSEYLKKYLLATWYRAEYWHIKGDTLIATDDAARTLQRTYYETAAKLYEEYVYRAVPGFGDQASMAFSLDIDIQAVQADRALRSCLDMYTATGNTQAAEPVYQTFCNRMSELWSFLAPDAEREWRPSSETREAWKNLKMQTQAHRRAGSVTPHELPPSEVRRVVSERPAHTSTVSERATQ